METLTYRRFLSTADAGWAAAYRLYEASFPPCERRSERDYDAALADGRLHAESVWDGDLFVGLVFWWLADEGYAYLEHLTVEPVLRGHNYGARILHDLCRRAGASSWRSIRPKTKFRAAVADSTNATVSFTTNTTISTPPTCGRRSPTGSW